MRLLFVVRRIVDGERVFWKVFFGCVREFAIGG
jgi:hypothetical protein